MTHPFPEPDTETIDLDERPCPGCDGDGERVHEGELLASECGACHGSGLLKDYDPSAAPFPDGY